MKSPSELAATYEPWANANEATAEEMLARLDSLPVDIQQQQRWRAGQIMADAAALKIRAQELRDLEGGIVELVEDGYKVPQDRNHGCGRPRVIWRYNQFR